MTVITQTSTDLASLAVKDNDSYRDKLIAILGASKIMTNQAEYPKDYDNSLIDGDAGYVAPIWIEVYDEATLSRHGFASREAVESAIVSASQAGA